MGNSSLTSCMIRSPSVTIPTRPCPPPPAAAPMPSSTISWAASVTVASGPMVVGSGVMMSLAVISAMRSLSSLIYVGTAMPASNPPTAAGMVPGTSSAVTQLGVTSRAAACPGPSVHVGAERAASNGEALRKQGADHAGEHVAGAGGARERTVPDSVDQGSSLRLTTVPAPLSTHGATGRRACATRIAYRDWTSAGVMPSRRASSPGCGVTTVGAVRARASSDRVDQRVQPVGVDHERQFELARRARAPRARARAPA